MKHTSEEKKSAIKIIKTLYESREKVINLFNDYSKIASVTKYSSIHGEGLKVLTPKQWLQRSQEI